MPKTSDLVNKNPWVPPPAKTSKTKKSFSISTVTVHEENVKEDSVTKEKIEGDIADSELGDVSLEAHTETSAYSQVQMHYSKECSDIYDQFQEFQTDLKLMRTHCHSLKSCSQLLHIPLKLSQVDEQAVRSMISQADLHINSFLQTFHELESHLEAFEIVAKEGTTELPDYLVVCQQTKELLILQLLKAYDSMTSVLKFLYEIQMHANLSSLHKDQDILKKKVESSRKQMTDLEKELTLCQQQIHSLQHQKSSIVEKNELLKRELSHKDIIIQRLKFTAESRVHLMENVADNERLLEVIEELHNKHKAEKEALKKALKVQKMRADQSVGNIENLKHKLNEKENFVYNLAAERDQWKMQLTAVNNKLIESESQIEDLQRKNLTLQDQINHFATSHQDEISKMKATEEEKSDLLEKFRKENELVKESASAMEKNVQRAEDELKHLKKKYDELNSTIQLQTENAYKSLENETKVLISLLQEVKRHLTSETETNNFQPPNNKHDGTTLLDLVKDVKEHLIDAKKICQQCLQGSLRTVLTESVERQNESEERLVHEIEERLKLQKRCEYLENALRNSARSVFTSNIQENFETYDLDPLKQHSIEEGINIERANIHISDPGSISRQEVEKKLKKQEEELEFKKSQIASLENQKSEVEKKYASQVKELQEKLTRVTLNYESLQKYVEILKSSYTNVFGVT